MFVRLARVSQLCVLAAQWRGRWKARLRGGGLGHLTCLMKHDGRDYAPNYTRRTAPTRHHALGFPDPVSGVFFESRFCFPVLCRIFGTPKSIKGRAERPHFFEFWSKSEYPYSANISSNFVILLEDFMCFFFVGGGGGGTPLKVAGRHPRRLRDDFVTIVDGFWYPFGSPGDHFGGHLGARVSKWSVYVDFSVLFLVPLKKERNSYQKSSKKRAFFEAADMAQV